MINSKSQWENTSNGNDEYVYNEGTGYNNKNNYQYNLGGKVISDNFINKFLNK